LLPAGTREKVLETKKPGKNGSSIGERESNAKAKTWNGLFRGRRIPGRMGLLFEAGPAHFPIKKAGSHSRNDTPGSANRL
jgi:hypothetical protein